MVKFSPSQPPYALAKGLQIDGCMELRAVLIAVEKTKSLSPAGNRIPISLSSNPYPSYNTDLPPPAHLTGADQNLVRRTFTVVPQY